MSCTVPRYDGRESDRAEEDLRVTAESGADEGIVSPGGGQGAMGQ